MIFNIGSEYNGVVDRDGNGNVVLDSNGNPTYQPTTDTVTASGLIGGTLLGDSHLHGDAPGQQRHPGPLEPDADRLGPAERGEHGDRPHDGRPLSSRTTGSTATTTATRRGAPTSWTEIPAAQIGGTTEYFGFPEMINGQLTDSYVKTIDAPGDPVTVVNPGVGVQPLVAFEPLADPVLTAEGSESEGASGFALSPSQFPAGLNHGVFIGFHGLFEQGGTANDENPLVFADPSTGHYFDFVSNDEAGVGHFDEALSTSNSLFLADISPGGSMESGAGQGAIYQIEAISTAPPPPPPPPNQPPVLSPISNQTVDEGVPLAVQASASDPDGDTITYSLAPAPLRERRSTRRPGSSPGRRTPTPARGPTRSPSSPPTAARRP